MSEIKPIFLYQPNIADWRPTKKGFVDFKKVGLQGETELIDRFPEQILDFNADQYHLVANAVLYSADIRRCKEKPVGAPNQVENVIFVDGGIDIYGNTTHRKTPEVYIDHTHGRLWFAVPRDAETQPYLEKLIFRFGEEPSFTIRRIIEGYRIQQQENRMALRE